MRILVADDSRTCRLLLGTVLNRWGYVPVMVDDGEKAWETLSVPEGPQLAILDWEMPRADGIKVCQRVRAAKLSRYVYLVLLTAKNAEADLLAGLEAGADDYLAKPVNLHQLKLRLRAAERVLTAERRHRLIAEVASDGIMTMSADGTIQFANHSAAAIFGLPVSELTNSSFSALVPGFSGSIPAPDAEAALHQPGPHGRSWAPVELFGRQRTGKLVSLEIAFAESVAESVQGAQKPLITAVIRNVTERKVRETQLAHVQKLESIGQLAAGVAHEINTPIQYIGDNLRFAQNAFRDIERMVNACRRLAEEMEPSAASGSLTALAKEIDLDYLSQQMPLALQEGIEGAQRVADIVKALREFSHPGCQEAAPVDLNHLIENVVLISKNKWKYVADLTMQLDAGLPPVKCLAGEMNQVLINLIVNAADAIAEAIRDRPEAKGRLFINTRQDGDFAEIRVCDNGTGIPKEAQSKVFDPFFTTKPVGSGTGQGLSIAYAIITGKHRGTIAFETEAGVGTSFIVRIPIDGVESRHKPAAAKAPGKRAGRKRSTAQPASLQASGVMA